MLDCRPTWSRHISPLEVERQPGPGQFESDGEEEVNLGLDCRPGQTSGVPGEVESCQSQSQTSEVAALRAGAAELDGVEPVESLGRLPDHFSLEPAVGLHQGPHQLGELEFVQEEEEELPGQRGETVQPGQRRRTAQRHQSRPQVLLGLAGSPRLDVLLRLLPVSPVLRAGRHLLQAGLSVDKDPDQPCQDEENIEHGEQQRRSGHSEKGRHSHHLLLPLQNCSPAGSLRHVEPLGVGDQRSEGVEEDDSEHDHTERQSGLVQHPRGGETLHQAGRGLGFVVADGVRAVRGVAVRRTEGTNRGALGPIAGVRQPGLQLLVLNLQSGVLVLQIADVVDG